MSIDRTQGTTLAEVLAALMLLAIVVPVALEAITVASRAGTLGQRKAAALRVAERVLNEYIATQTYAQNTGSGTVNEGATTYNWTMETTTWSQDSLTQMTVRVSFPLQGQSYEVSATTLFDPSTTASSSTTSSSQ